MNYPAKELPGVILRKMEGMANYSAISPKILEVSGTTAV